jgi:formylglycine-generating enzyme
MKPLLYSGSKFSVLFAVLVLVFGNLSAYAKREIEGQVFVVTEGSQNVKLGLVPIWVLGQSEMKALAKQAVELADAVQCVREMDALEAKLSELENKAKKELGEESAQKVKKAAENERATIRKSTEALYSQTALQKSLLEKINKKTSRQEQEIDGDIATRVALRSESLVTMLMALLAEREPDAESDADGRFKVRGDNPSYIVACSQRTVGKSATSGSFEDAERYHWVVELPQRKNQLFLSNNNNSEIIEAEAKLRLLASAEEGVFSFFKKPNKHLAKRRITGSGEAQKTYEEERTRVESLESEKRLMNAGGRLEAYHLRLAKMKVRGSRLASEGSAVLDITGRVLLLIPKGRFQMGSNEDSLDSNPRHSVSVDTFYMGETEVTYGEWQAVIKWAKANGYEFSSPGNGRSDGHAVTNVSWYDVVKWCNAKSQKEGLSPCYKIIAGIYQKGEEARLTCDWNANGYRLPTEAEWEKAARGGLVGKKFPNGDSSGETSANRDGIGSPDEVGKYTANGYGLYDMVGNVWEWCWDWKAPYSWYSPYIVTYNPQGAVNGSERVYRGGYNYGTSEASHNACRGSVPPTLAADSFGFRLVRGRL